MFQPFGQFTEGDGTNRFQDLYVDTFYLSREMLLMDKGVIRSHNYVSETSGFIIRQDGTVEFNSIEALSGTLGTLTVSGVLTLADPTGQLNTGVTGGPAGNWFGLTGGSSSLVWYINDGIGGTLVDAQLGFTAASGSRVDTLYSIGPLEFPWNVQPALTFTRGTSTNDTGIGGSDSEVSFWAAGSQVAEFNASGLSMTQAIAMPDTKNIVFGTDSDWAMRWDHASTKLFLYYVPASGVGTFDIFGNSSSTVVLNVEGPVRVSGGTLSAPDLSWQGDTDTGFYSYGVNQIGVALGGAHIARWLSVGLQGDATGEGRVVFAGAGSASAPTFSWAGDTNSGMYRYGADQVAIGTGGAARLVVANASIQANDGSTGLVEIFPKNYIAAGTVQTASVNLTTTETEFGTQTIACEYANQPVLVTVSVWLRVVKSDNLVYTWVRAAINNTGKGAQVPLHDSVTGASRVQMVASEWTEEVTADGSGNVKVGIMAKVESGTSNGNVVQVTYRVERR